MRVQAIPILVLVTLSFAPQTHGEPRLVRLKGAEPIPNRVGQLSHLGPVLATAFSGDGKLLLTGSADKSAQLWNVETGVVIHRFEHLHTLNPVPLSEITAVALSHDGRLVATAGVRRIRVSGPAGGVATLAFADAVREAAGEEPLQRFAVRADIRLWDTRSGAEIRSFTGASGWIASLAFSHDGLSLAAGGEDHTVRIWQVRTGKQVRQIETGADIITFLAFCPRSKRILIGTSQGHAGLWGVDNDSNPQDFKGHLAPIRSAAFSCDESWLLTGSNDKTARLWDVATGKEFRRFGAHSGTVTSVAFSLDRQSVWTAATDGIVRRWALHPESETAQTSPSDAVPTPPQHSALGMRGAWLGVEFEGTTLTSVLPGSPAQKAGLKAGDVIDAADDQEIESCAQLVLALGNKSPGEKVKLRINRNGQTLTVDTPLGVSPARVFTTALATDLRSWVIGDEYGAVAQLSTKSGEAMRRFEGHRGEIRAATICPDGKFVVTGSTDTTARIWEVTTGRELERLAGHTGEIRCVAVSRDGTRILTGSQDGTARAWDVGTGRQLATLGRFNAPVQSLAFSPDARRFLVGVQQRSVLFDATTGTEVRSFPGHENVAFSADGSVVWSRSGGAIAAWQTDTGAPISQLSTASFGTQIASFDFSPDGKQLVACNSQTPRFRLYDVATKQKLHEFDGHTEPVNVVLFSPDGRQILSNSTDGTTRIWDTGTAKQEHTLESGSFWGQQSCDFSDDGQRVMTVAFGPAIIWDLQTGRQISRLGNDQSKFSTGYFLPKGRGSVLCSGVMPPQRIALWDATSTKELQHIDFQMLQVRIGKCRHVAVSPDWRYLAICYDDDPRVLIWDVAETKLLHDFEHSSRYAVSLSFSPDGRLLVASGETTCVWDVRTGKERHRLEGFFGRFVAAGSKITTRVFHFDFGGRRRSKFCLWDAKTGERLAEFSYTAFPGHFGGTTAFAPSPDGRHVVTTGNDCAVRLWDSKSRAIRRSLRGHSAPTVCCEFFPDGSKIATASWDRTAAVWDTQSGEVLRRYPHKRPVLAVSLDATGDNLLAATTAGTFAYSLK